MSLKPPDNLPPDHWSRVQRIEKEKFKEEPEKEPGPKPILFSTFYVYFKKLYQSLFPKTIESSSVDKQQVLEDLLSLKKMLQILGSEDQSRNAEFIQQLSELWHNLTQDCNVLNLSSRKNDQELVKIKNFLSSFGHFPRAEEHTMGYYLTEYVGPEWLPFPFMDLLKALHEEFRKNPQKSQIDSWIEAIDELVFDLERMIEPL